MKAGGSCLGSLGIEGASLGFGFGSSTSTGIFGLASFSGFVFSCSTGGLDGLVGLRGSGSVRSTTSDCTFLLWVGVVPAETFGRLGARLEDSGIFGGGW